MDQTAPKLASHDPVWHSIRQSAIALAGEEPILGSLVHASVLNQSRFEDALNYILAQRLGTEDRDRGGKYQGQTGVTLPRT